MNSEGQIHLAFIFLGRFRLSFVEPAGSARPGGSFIFTYVIPALPAQARAEPGRQRCRCLATEHWQMAETLVFSL
jgi:hypothetical protein